jgi:hypothetical protein
VGSATTAAFGVEGEDGHPAGEELFEAFDRARGAFAAPCPAVFVVHVEDEVDGHIALDDAGEQQAAEEGLAGARFAEHGRRTLDQPLQAQGDLHILHLQGSTDMKIVDGAAVGIAAGAFGPEHIGHFFRSGRRDRRVMAGDGLDRPRDAVVFVQLQQRRDMEPAEGAGPQIDLAQEVVVQVGGGLLEGGMGAIEGDIGNHAEEEPAPGLHDHITAHGQVLQAPVMIESHFQAAAERTGHHPAQAGADIGMVGLGAEGGKIGIGMGEIVHRAVLAKRGWPRQGQPGERCG